MKRFPFLFALVALAGCGYSEDSFEEDMIDAMCNKMDECGWLDDLGWTLDECLNQSSTDTGGEECVDYDGGAAKDCVTAVEDATCDDYAAGTGLDVCEDVCSND